MYCSSCGAFLPEGTKFCTQCGTPVTPPRVEPPEQEAPSQAQTQTLEPAESAFAPDSPSDATEWLSPDAMRDARAAVAPPAPPAVRPAAPPPAPPRAAKKPVSPLLIVIIAAAGVALIAAIVIAVVLWLPNKGNPHAVTADEPAINGASDGEMVNWVYYEGTWAVEEQPDVTFSVHLEGDRAEIALRQGAQSITATGDLPEDGELSAAYEGGELILRADGQRLSLTATGSLEIAEAAAVRAGAEIALPKSGDPVELSWTYLYYDGEKTVSQAPNPLPVRGGDFQFWPTDVLLITNADLDRLTREEIHAIRNEIFARYGFPFGGETGGQWYDLFSSMSWYHYDADYVEPQFPPVVRANIDTVVAYETAKGWRS